MVIIMLCMRWWGVTVGISGYHELISTHSTLCIIIVK